MCCSLAAGAGTYARTAAWRPPRSSCTGIVTTNDVIVSPQIAGQIGQLLVTEGDAVKKDQLVAVIAPDELKADTAYFAQNVEGMSSQIRESEAALRLQERQTADQIRQAESTLASIEAQVEAAAADVEQTRASPTRGRRTCRGRGVVSPQELDSGAHRADGARRRKLDALKKQVEAQRATVALARSNAEQTAVRRSQVQTSEHMKQAAVGAAARRPTSGCATPRSTRRSTASSTSAPARVGEVVDPGPADRDADQPRRPVGPRRRRGELHRSRAHRRHADRAPAVGRRARRARSSTAAPTPAFATQRDVSRTKRDIKTFEVAAARRQQGSAARRRHDRLRADAGQ